MSKRKKIVPVFPTPKLKRAAERVIPITEKQLGKFRALEAEANQLIQNVQKAYTEKVLGACNILLADETDNLEFVGFSDSPPGIKVRKAPTAPTASKKAAK